MSLPAGAFESPEEAAMDGFPPQYCHVVASRVRDDDAYVLIETGSDGRSYLYGVTCRRQHGVWSEVCSSNAPGWGPTGPDPLRGTLVCWDEVPPHADRVRIQFDGRLWEEPVVDGAYLAAWWNVPCPRDKWPHVVAVRVKGEWT